MKIGKLIWTISVTFFLKTVLQSASASNKSVRSSLGLLEYQQVALLPVHNLLWVSSK